MPKMTRDERRELRKRRQAAQEEKIRNRQARKSAQRDPSQLPNQDLESFHAGRPIERPAWPMTSPPLPPNSSRSLSR